MLRKFQRKAESFDFRNLELEYLDLAYEYLLALKNTVVIIDLM